jgi:hypothetical protein
MAGFKLNRPDGSVAIDSNYFNLALRQKGSLVLSNVPNSSTPSFKNGAMAVAGDQCIIAYRSSHPVVVFTGRRNGNILEFTFGGMSNNGNINVDWWLFDLPQYALQYASGGKMIVRRPSDGVTVFDSRNKYLKVMDFVSPDSTVAQRRSYGKLPAVVMSNYSWSSVAVSINAGNQTMVRMEAFMARAEGNDIVYGGEITSMDIRDSQHPKWAYSGGKPDLLIVDVQDY